MTKEEALELFKNTPITSAVSKVNPSLTQLQCRSIIMIGVEQLGEGAILDTLLTKRVHQVIQNKRRPIYD